MPKLSQMEHEREVLRIVNKHKVGSKRLVYLAGPYTYPSPTENTNKALKKANELQEKNPEWVVFVPHLSILWDIFSVKSAQHWYDYDLHILERCDILYRMEGYSLGADGEVEIARKLGKPIIFEGKDETNQIAATN